MFNYNLSSFNFVEGCKLIGAGCATIGVIGAGVGIVIFLEIFF